MPGSARPPEIRPRALGPSGTLGGDYARGIQRSRDLLQSGRDDGETPPGLRSGSEVALTAEAFRTTTDAAREKLERILSGEGALVATGHQPIVFGGPLYVLYKALSAVRRAERLEEESGRPTLALFGVGSDDHDWDEIGTLRLLDVTNELRAMRLDPAEGWAGRPAGPSPVSDSARELLDELSQILPESEFVESYLELLRDAYRPGERLASAFAELLVTLVRPRPLAVLDSAAQEVKVASAPLLARALEGADAERAAVERATRAVRDAGYEAQMPILEGASHVFLDTGSGRERLYVRDGTVRAGREGEPAPLGDVQEELARAPERFSPNVALRPVLEAWLLPVAEAVLGPGELAYWAQLPELFALHGVRMPRPVGRHAWVVVEEKVQKVLRKVGAEAVDFADGGDGLVEDLVERARPETVREALGELRAAMGSSLQRVEAAVEEELPGIRASVGKVRGDLFAAVAELEAAVDDRLEERQEVVVRQIRKAARHLFPGGDPQERALSPLYYLARYGGSFVEAVDRATRRTPAGTPPGGEAADRPAE